MNTDLASKIQQRTIQKVFEQREDFIVLGLTGATGSRLSELTDILGRKTFEDIELPEDITGTDTEKLEYRNICSYAKVHWKQFDIIKARDVIITYILENRRTVQRFYNDLSAEIFKDVEFINKCYRKFEMCIGRLGDHECEVKQEIQIFRNECFKIGLEEMLLKKNLELLNYVDVLRKKHTSEHNTRIGLSLYTYTKYILPLVGKSMRECIPQREKYIEIFRRYGNEIRFFGTLDDHRWKEKLLNIAEIENYDYFYSLAKRINTFIKIRRSPFSNRKSVPLRIVIDSLKNSYEFNFLRDRYSAYYTIALLDYEAEKDKKYHQEDVFYENPGKTKVAFKTFISLIIEQVELNSSIVNNEDYQYINALSSLDKFVDYMLEHIDKENELDFNIEWCSDLKELKYNSQYARMGVSQSEFNYFKKVLQEPVRTLCLMSELYPFYLQDIQNAMQDADIFLSTANDLDGKKLSRQLVKYVTLIMHPGLVTPTKIETCMQQAYCAKVNSGCISRQVGAVVTDKDYNILSLGWNDAHCGKTSCIYRNLWELKNGCNHCHYSDFEVDGESPFGKEVKKYLFGTPTQMQEVLDGVPPTYCFKAIYNGALHVKNPVNSRAIHAEQMAFYSCDKEKARGGYLFTTSSSCDTCTMFANLHGIKKIYYIENYPGIAQLHVNASGPQENRAEFILFEGAIGSAYIKLFTPIIPLKDELQLRGIETFRKKDSGEIE